MGSDLHSHMRSKHAREEKNPDWVAQSLREERKAHAEVISRSPEGRSLRRSNMIFRNQSTEAREVSRRTAVLTSSRPDVLTRRTAALSNWRSNHRDDFYEKCTKKMHGAWQSKPEKKLGEVLSQIPGFSFRHNQTVKSASFMWPSHRKQVDYVDKERRVYVEFDGYRHFHEFKGNNMVEIKMRDDIFDAHIISNNWMLIRISYDQFQYTGGGHFKEDCLERLRSILSNPTPGVHTIGHVYEARNDKH